MHLGSIYRLYKSKNPKTFDTSSDFLFPSAIKDLSLLLRASGLDGARAQFINAWHQRLVGLLRTGAKQY